MSDLTLYIGTKNLSSWSLRPWLALKHIGVPFAEVEIPLRRPDTRERILAPSPSGRVPALRHGDLVVWDSMAIVEYLAETFPDARLWPEHPRARAGARAAAPGRRSGFAALRTHMPMDIRGRQPGKGREAGVAEDIARVTAIWRALRARFGTGGPYLMGAFGAVDAFFAPVCTRFVTYGVELDPEAQAYVETISNHPAMREWAAAS